MKGQHLRLFVDGKCIAAATSCNVHVSAQVEDASTKDTVGDWTENRCTGISWYASADALVMASRMIGGLADTGDVVTISNVIYRVLASAQPIKLKAGDTLHVETLSGTNKSLVVLNEAMTSVIHTALLTPGAINWTSTSAQTVVVAYSGTAGIGALEAYVDESSAQYLDDVMDYFDGQLVDVSLDITDGELNRESDTSLYAGQAYVTDISITAANRQNSTYTVQLTGNGKLERVED